MHHNRMKNRRRLSRTLQGRIEGCPDKNLLSADEVVNYLRSAFNEYDRTQVRGLTRQVQSILEETKIKLENDDGGASDSSGLTTSDKKKRHSEEEEEECDEPEFNLLGKRKRARKDDEAVESKVVTNRNQKVDQVKAKKRVKESDSRGGSDEETVKFKDLGGMDELLDELTRKVTRPLLYSELARHFGGKPTTGILLHGPPGCGKTSLAHAIANETGLPFYATTASRLGSEEKVRELFSKAFATAPSIVFIDEIDARASKRDGQQRAMDTGIVTELMSCMEKSRRLAVGDSESENSGYVLVICATNRPDAIDPGIRRPGRFDREILLPVPDQSARIQILSLLMQKVKVEGDIDLLKIARATPGFVGADLARLIDEASNLALNKLIDAREKLELLKRPWSPEVEKAGITMAEFEVAARTVQPSTSREGFSEIPNVKWDDIGGLHDLRQELNNVIIECIKFPENYERFGMDLETGVLLYGPPGCGKTLIAKAVANEVGAKFIHVKGAELLNKYVGESEKAARALFSRARACSPCIIFFDEVDALTKKHGSKEGGVTLLNTLLSELDGGDNRKGVYVIGATNRPEIMNPAFLRPGRFGKPVYVPLPSAEERGLILKALTRKLPLDAGVDLMAIGRDACENFSGADLGELMKRAARAAGRDHSDAIKNEHILPELENVSPSVSQKQLRRYLRLSKKFKAGL